MLNHGLAKVLEAEPDKLDIKRCEPGILFRFTLQTSYYYLIFDFRVDSTSLTTLFKKYNIMLT